MSNHPDYDALIKEAMEQFPVVRDYLRRVELRGYAKGVTDALSEELPHRQRITDNPRSSEDIHD